MIRFISPSTVLWPALLMMGTACWPQATSAWQTPIAATASTAVPSLVAYTGIGVDGDGKPLSGEKAVTFLVFKDESGGEPLWVETQTVALDATGHYQVQLGASSPAGLPATTFASGEGRWLEVQIAGQAVQGRVLLSSVPYAMKAAEAETLGGLSAQNFVTQAQLAAAAKNLAAQASPVITPFVTPSGSGTANSIPIWTSSTALGNSVMAQSGGNINIGSSATAASLGVYGNISNSASGTYTNLTSSSYNSVGYEGSRIAFNRYDGTLAAPTVVKSNDTVGWFDFFGYDGSAVQRVGQFSMFVDATPSAGIVPGRFEIETASSTGADTARLIAYSNDNVVMAQHGGKVGIGTGATPAATLEVNGTAQFDGNITFASTQTFPVKGTGGGTVTSVASGLGLTGGPITTSGTLSVDSTKVPFLGNTNNFLEPQTISGGSLSITNGSLSLPNTESGNFGTILIGGYPFLHGCCAASQENTFVGPYAGNYSANASGNGEVGNNTGIGYSSLSNLTSGNQNTGVGAYSLDGVFGGTDDTGIGYYALNFNTTGAANTAVGSGALKTLLSGSQDTAIGYGAGNQIDGNSSEGFFNTFVGAGAGTSLNNIYGSTAIGYSAQVNQDYSMSLGGAGVFAVSVGINTPTPYNDYGLDVEALNSTSINGGVVVNTNGGNLYLGMTNSVHKFRVDTNGYVYADGGYNSSGADFAESMAVHGSKSEYEPGDLLVIDRGAKRSLALARTPYSTLVAGIYSTKPGLLASPHHIEDPEIDMEVPLAVVGIVPCKVTAQNGPIREGDLLVTSSRAGYAMKGVDRRRMLGAVVGKALEPLDKGDGVIQVLVTLQ
jgi:hypothetical protein